MSVQGRIIILVAFVCLTSAAPPLGSRQKRQTIFFEDELEEQGTPNQGTSNTSQVDMGNWLSRNTRTRTEDDLGAPAFPSNRDAHVYDSPHANHNGVSLSVSNQEGKLNWQNPVTTSHGYRRAYPQTQGQGNWHNSDPGTHGQGNRHTYPQTHGQGNWHTYPQTQGQGNWHTYPQTQGQGNWHGGDPGTHGQGNWHTYPQTQGQGNWHGGDPRTHGQGNWQTNYQTHGQGNWHTTNSQVHGLYGGNVPQSGIPLGHSPQYSSGPILLNPLQGNSLLEYAKGPVDESWIRRKRQTNNRPTGNNRLPVSGPWSPNQPTWNEIGNGNNGPEWDRPGAWFGDNNGGAWNGNNQWSNGNERGTGAWNGNQNWNGNSGWNGNQRPGGNGNGGVWNSNNQRPNGSGNQNSWNSNNGGSWTGNNPRPNGNNNNGGSWNGNNQRPNANSQNSWDNNNGGSSNENNNRPTQNAAGDNGNFGNFGNSIAPTLGGNNNNRPRPGGSNGNIRPPIAIGGVRPPSTPAPNCDCPATNETNPVCGTDGNTYVNPSRLRCARVCGSNVRQKHYGACTATSTPATNLRRG